MFCFPQAGGVEFDDASVYVIPLYLRVQVGRLFFVINVPVRNMSACFPFIVACTMCSFYITTLR